MRQVGTLNYMSPEAILGGTNNIRGGAPMKVRPHQCPNVQNCIHRVYEQWIVHRDLARCPSHS